MADCEEHCELTNRPKKRKITGRINEVLKKQKLSSHTTGPDCKCTRYKCFEVVSVDERARLLDSFNALSSKEYQDSFLAGLITVYNVTRRRSRKNEIILKDLNDNSYKYKVFKNIDNEFT